jgi:transposase
MSIVGIDIASKSATFCVLGNTGVISQEDHFDMSVEGFKFLLSSPHINKDSTFIMESTASYHLPLYNFLLNQNRKAYIINPSLISKYKANNTLRKTKTDPLDAVLIASYANRPEVQLEGRSSALETESKILSRSRLTNSEDLAKAKTRLKGNLSVSFPEMLKFNVYTDSMLNFLSVYGCAKDVLNATDKQIEKAIKGDRNQVTPRDKELAKTLKKVSKESIGVALHASMTIHSAKTVKHLSQEDKFFTDALINIEKEIHSKEIEIITSIPGISDISAAHFMAEVEDITRFATYQKLIAFIGTDPTIYQSGKVTKNGKISKKGNKILRKYCYIMATSCVHWNPVLGEYYKKKRSEGFPHRKAMVATVNKLIRTIYALLIRGEKLKMY